MTPPSSPHKEQGADRRKDRILALCSYLERLGCPDYALLPVREYAESIAYCTCGHERAGKHGNGIVDRRCFVPGCPCLDFTPETEPALEGENQ